MSYYPDSHIKDKVKVLLDLSNYATKKELEHATGVDTSDLVAKKDFIASKSEVDMLDVNELLKFSTGLNNLKTEVDDLDVGELKTVPKVFKKISDAMDKGVVKNTKLTTLNSKLNNLEKNIPDASTLNQNITDKQNLQNKNRDVEKNSFHRWFSDCSCS